MKYRDELIRAMDFLGNDSRTIFVGQCVGYPGNAIYKTLANVPAEKKLELPVFEEVQMGMSIGLALEGLIPVTIYPRFNFLLLAMNQLVNHLDKIPGITQGGAKPNVIIRTLIGSVRPIDAGVQHSGDFTDGFRALAKNIEVIRLDEPEQIFPAYERALHRTDGKSTIIVEWGDYYNEK
jgi:pyruvate/2-oxoglutarate/acetoin dehydrogenase E1 component